MTPGVPPHAVPPAPGSTVRSIKKIFNNNIVQAVSEDGDDVILVGAGIGFETSRGRPVDESRVEREFHLTGQARSGAFRVLLEVPFPVLSAVSRMSVHLANRHGVMLSSTAEVGLADHLAQTISRLDRGLTLFNPLLWETKATYPAEFAMALECIDIVHEDLGRRLPLDEAGSIALHLVNSGVIVDTNRAFALGTALRRVIEIIDEDLGVQVDASSATATRFLTHVKFVIERLSRDRVHRGALDDFFESIRAEHDDVYACAVHIGEFLDSSFRTRTTSEEHLYLMLHLLRLREESTPPAAADLPPDRSNGQT